MTSIGALIYELKHNNECILYPDGGQVLWKAGTDDKFVEATKYFTQAYFSHPKAINPYVDSVCIKPLHLAGAEGFFSEWFELFHS